MKTAGQKFSSPWARPLYGRSVGLIRRLLRALPGMESRYINSLVARQNARVQEHLRRFPPRKVLLILPRCVKKTGCPAEVRQGLQQCLECRDCPLGDVARLCRRHDIEALVAFRSHIAFAMARTEQPDVIVATACHDRLIKALRNVPEIPALLAPLTSMENPCRNAQIDLDWLGRELDMLAEARDDHVPRQVAALEAEQS